MTIGNLPAEPATARPDLLAAPVLAALRAAPDLARDVFVAEIDPALADTAAFCERYGVRLDESANCVVLTARREGRAWFAACMILATARIDVNGVVKKHLGASKLWFASTDDATAASRMEFGGITPIGLPSEWPLLLDAAVAASERVVVGSGVRRSKLTLPGAALATLPNAQTLPIALSR